MELNEVTFQGKAEQLRPVAKFIEEFADPIETNPGKFDHDHISSSIKNWDEDYPEIVIAEE